MKHNKQILISIMLIVVMVSMLLVSNTQASYDPRQNARLSAQSVQSDQKPLCASDQSQKSEEQAKTGLIASVRQWVTETFESVGRIIDEKYLSYYRKAYNDYLSPAAWKQRMDDVKAQIIESIRQKYHDKLDFIKDILDISLCNGMVCDRVVARVLSQVGTQLDSQQGSVNIIVVKGFDFGF
ncbi:hypothetical protein K9N50_08295 [bacterium]|nr:hypothetical protein [bacterium]